MTDINEVLRYLGYRGSPGDKQVLKSIDSCIEELSRAVSPRGLSRIFDVNFKDGAVWLGTLKIESADLARHLSGCKEAVLFAATLGTQADFLLERTSKTDMSRAVVMQACAAVLIESYCDNCEQDFSAEAAQRGLFLRPRYSPGYGDFPIRYQRNILGILDCQKKIGLTMTDGFMLAPSKSVTAVIGLTSQKTSCHIAKCMECQSLNCPFRKG